MTREERISWLKQIENDIYVDSLGITYEEYMKSRAIYETIQALQTEPCEDAVSRQAVMDIVDFYKTNPQHYSADALIDDIQKLSPVQPEQKVGKWKRVSIDKYVQHAMAYFYRCTECGGDNIGMANYCPNCGEKKFVPQESEDEK